MATGSDAPATTTTRVRGWNKIFLVMSLFVALFGLLNFVELSLGWKDQLPQLTRYLSATGVLGPHGAHWAMALLWLQKGIGAGLAMLPLVALWRRDVRLLVAAILGWMVVMTYLIVMDILAADRAELLEHSVYFAVLVLTLTGIKLLRAMAAIREDVRRHPS